MSGPTTRVRNLPRLSDDREPWLGRARRGSPERRQHPLAIVGMEAALSLLVAVGNLDRLAANLSFPLGPELDLVRPAPTSFP
jgi:hypothetical protein